MKKDIHPKYKSLKVIIGEDSFAMKSTYGGEEYRVDIDYRKHPAWVGGGVSSASNTNKNISNFNKKFGNLSFGPRAGENPAGGKSIKEPEKEGEK